MPVIGLYQSAQLSQCFHCVHRTSIGILNGVHGEYIRGMDALLRETTLSKVFLLPFGIGYTLKGKNVLPRVEVFCF